MPVAHSAKPTNSANLGFINGTGLADSRRPRLPTTVDLVTQLMELSEKQRAQLSRSTALESVCVLAERLLRQRRQREAFFGKHLFADPCWDMLLDLYVARKKRLRPVSVSSLCIASAVPATTALRWIDTLVQEGLVVRQPDPRDKRRVLVSLTDEGSHKLDRLLTDWLEP
jgi:predicted transcriptional regulator